MAGLKQIKSKIRSVKKTRQVTKAMEAVSAVKMRKSQQKAIGGRAYARAASSVLARLSGSRAIAHHPLTAHRVGGKKLYIVITSDKGLAGALNSAVLRMSAGVMRPGDAVVAIGRKAQDFFTNRHVPVLKYHPNTDVIDAAQIDVIVGKVAEQFLSGAYDEVRIVYQNFISTFEQRPTMHTIFPLQNSELQKVVEGIVPAKGAFSAQAGFSGDAPVMYTVEPNEESVLDVILPKLASVFVYHALLESQASEHSARMVSMKSASDKAGEMTHALTLKFNKARQAAITREVSEIIGGMEAIAN